MLFARCGAGYFSPLLPPAFVSAASADPKQQRSVINRNTVFAWIIHAKSTFPDQCRGLAEGEEGRGKKNKKKPCQDAHRHRMYRFHGDGLLSHHPVLHSDAGDPAQHPKARQPSRQALHRGVMGVQLPSRPQQWGSAPPIRLCPRAG